jgi:hypothetical protein
MARLGDLVVTIGAKTKSFDKALGDSMRKLKNFGRNTKRLGKDLSMGITAPLAIMGGTAVQAFRVQAKAIAQVEAGLRSTGGQVGYTSKQLQDMASSLQGKTLFGDEDILQNATAQLLTFTNISGDQFARTQAAALDLATRLDGDLKGASIQLGKALNDPVANLSALSRSGIQFSDEQKEVIKSLAESGRLAEAQTLILDELNKQYGGSAEAAAKADGGLTQLANAFGDLQEQFGAILVDVLRPLVDWASDMIAQFQGLSKQTKQYIVVGAGIAAMLGPLIFILPQIGAVIGAIISPVGLVIAAIALLATGIYMFADEVSKPLADVANFFISLYNESKAVRAIIGGIKGTVKVVFGFFAFAVSNIIEQFKDLGSILKAALEGRFSDIPGLITDAFARAGERTAEFARQAALDWKTSVQDELDKEPIEFVTPESIASGIKRIGGLKDAIDNMFSGGGGGTSDTAQAAGATAKPQVNLLPERGLVAASGPVAAMAADMGKMRNEFSMMIDMGPQITSAFVGIGEAIGGLVSGTMTMADIMGQAFAGLGGFLMDLGAQFVSAGVAASAFYASLISNPPLAIAAGVALVAAGAAIKGFQSRAQQSPPALAKGGLAFGETMALVGDNPNAGTDPEVIAPLSKLRGMMGGSGQHVTVTGRISGRDLLLSNDRTQRARARYGGY